MDNDGLQGTLDKLNGETLTNAIDSLVENKVKVYLPKFIIETYFEMTDILKAVSKKPVSYFFIQ